VGLAHFNHQLRPAAQDDERFCVGVAESIGVPILADREDAGAAARREKRSIEVAARALRYQFLEGARAHFSADVVALGHTRDDQAETFLLRLVRGAGAKGLAAMHPKRGAFIRPLLHCRRSDLLEYLDARSLVYVTDDSNVDLSIPRNRVRAELLPLLERRFNPSIADALADEAEVAREEWQWMSDAATALAIALCRREGEVCRIDAQAVNQLPVALARVLVQTLMAGASHERTVPFAHVEAALQLARGEGAAFDAPGQRVERVGSDLVLTGRRVGHVGRTPGREARGSANFFHYALSIPGEVQLAEAGVIVSAEAAAASTAVAGATGTQVAAVRRDRCPGPLAVRNRRPGDRFSPLGLGGRKKLQDYFVDRKVARDDRDRVPLVVDESDRIVWVAGHSIDAEFRVTDPAQGVLILKVRRV
jgi:tRNA(Ile)-lysidine synthase